MDERSLVESLLQLFQGSATPIPSSSIPPREPTPRPEYDPISGRNTGFPGWNDYISGRVERPAIDPIADVIAPGAVQHALSPVGRALITSLMDSEAGALGKPMYKHLPQEIIDELKRSAATRPGGRPIRMYHGSPDPIEGDFDPQKVYQWDIGGKAVSLTEEPGVAGEKYAGGGYNAGHARPQVVPAYLKAERPFDWEAPVSGEDIEEIIRRAVNADPDSTSHDPFYTSGSNDLAGRLRDLWYRNIHGHETIPNRALYNELLGNYGYERVREMLEILGYDSMKLVENDAYRPYTTWQAFKGEQVVPALAKSEATRLTPNQEFANAIEQIFKDMGDPGSDLSYPSADKYHKKYTPVKKK